MRRKEINATSGETIEVTNLWAAECEERSATVLTSEWTCYGLQLASPALSGSTATVKVVDSDSWGTSARYNLRNKVTLSNGETLVAERYVCVS